MANDTTTSLGLGGYGLPDLVSLQKKAFPLLFTKICSFQPTTQPIATAFGLLRSAEADDSSGWAPYKFTFSRWASPVASEKLKTPISVEALQDLGAQGVPQTIVTDNIAEQVADDINHDIILKLNYVSTEDVTGLSVSSALNEYEQGRVLYAVIHQKIAEIERTTGAQGAYVVCGGNVYGKLLGTAFLKKADDGEYAIAASGVLFFNDKYTSGTNYATIGVKKVMGDFEMSTLVYSPYEVDGTTFSYLEAIDPKSLSPVIGVISRYAITTAPLNAGQTDYFSIDDWATLDANHRSPLSVKYAVSYV